ncbi:hypothetical protein GCM10025869_06890 [Homoserinibacter gongjuensis]|jgi:hypothetical protein|uniref:Secreted protein n=1 Tax=Homoserinibacter gongjuensis TaxID=1162968 RepID=A0ABQ6JTZ1_9MICO|nr:hypothetical protein GCM10025869_06890 [Homoserinibacter gongjuensis]
MKVMVCLPESAGALVQPLMTSAADAAMATAAAMLRLVISVSSVAGIPAVASVRSEPVVVDRTGVLGCGGR